MTILCGTDFSDLGTSATRVAAALAKASNQPLMLAHVLDFPASEKQEPDRRELVEKLTRKLEAQAERLRQDHAEVSAHVLFGDLAEALIAQAYEHKVQLLVVGAHGRDASSPFHLGTVADKLAAKSGVPLLVVRAEDALCAWAIEQRPLRVIVGADESVTTDAAVSFLSRLQALAPCDVTAVHLFWPPTVFERLGLSGVRSYLELDPVVQRTLTEELEQRLGGIPVQVQPHLGNVGERLASIAADSGADLTVVGCHGRTGVDSLWHGSISRDLLHKSQLSVLTVPAPTTPTSVRRFQRGLVATDFTEPGNSALALAFAAVPADGIVHIVHVIPPRAHDLTAPSDIFAPEEGATPAWHEAAAKLNELGQRQAALTPCRFRVHVLESAHPAKAIAQAAERLHTDFVCLSSSSQPAVSRLVMGSVVRSVLAESQRPVLLAQARQR